jgi:hypothetical protein
MTLKLLNYLDTRIVCDVFTLFTSYDKNDILRHVVKLIEEYFKGSLTEFGDDVWIEDPLETHLRNAYDDLIDETVYIEEMLIVFLSKVITIYNNNLLYLSDRLQEDLTSFYNTYASKLVAKAEEIP